MKSYDTENIQWCKQTNGEQKEHIKIQAYLCGVARPFPELAPRQKGSHVRQGLRWWHPLPLCCCQVLGSRFWLLTHRTALALMMTIRNSFFSFQLGLSCATVSPHISLGYELLPVFCSVSRRLRPRDGHAGFSHIAMWRGWGRGRGVGGGRVRA